MSQEKINYQETIHDGVIDIKETIYCKIAL